MRECCGFGGGVIIGAAFGRLFLHWLPISMPLGLLIGGIDFKQFAFTLRGWGDIRRSRHALRRVYQNVFDFVIVAFIFVAIKHQQASNRKNRRAGSSASAF
ncbi:MscL family protein [Salmonella enterica subsp. enterica]|nr:MscL family protein [Salmonella enterica subsp. enterica]